MYILIIETVKIPERLETDTDFLTIDGTDTNDAYRQNIREKEIELELTLGECDLQTSTDMLRQLAKLLVNEKDSYNRPIPNRIETYFFKVVKLGYRDSNPGPRDPKSRVLAKLNYTPKVCVLPNVIFRPTSAK